MGVLNSLMQSVGLAAGPQAPMHVSSLWVYPVKGCRGCQVSSAQVETTGEVFLYVVCVEAYRLTVVRTMQGFLMTDIG